MKSLIAIIVLALASVANAQAGTHSVSLSWTAPTTGGAPASYNVYQTTTSGACATSPATATGCTKVGSTTVPTTTYTAGNLNGNTTYYWVVTAVNASGESASSNQASATTPVDAPTAPTNLTVTGVK